MEPAKETVYVLAVDDLPEKLMAMELVLQQPGLVVVQARSGREALRRLLEQDFAVILLDVNMPDMDGFETARLVRQRERSEHTPIIFVTAFSDELHAARGYSLGAVDYILSPVIPEVLRTKVGVFVDLFRKNEDAKRQAEERVALAREQAARAVAEEATRRSLFLAEASTALANSLDFEATWKSLLKLLVPSLADLAGFTAPTEPERPWHTEIAWISPVDGSIRKMGFDATEGTDNELRAAVREVLVSGKPATVNGLAIAYPPEENASGHRLRSALVLPLLARGRILGAMSLAQGASGRNFDPATQHLAGELANRAAVALDNARLYRELQDADRQKNEFLAMLAHELRNPLAPIRNAVQVLQAENSTARQQQWSKEVIARQVDQMVRMVDDLLDVSRITRGKIALRTSPVDVASVVADAVETSRPLIDSRHHELIVSIPPEPLPAEGDATRLAQVVANLLNNAAKYTDEGGRIWLSVERDAEEIVVRVRDTGQGVPPEMLSRIFEPFTQVDRSIDRSQGGLGIGLTLARRLIELHGGRISAHSSGPGSGSEFIVRLPALASPVQTPQPANGWHRESDRSPTTLRTLIIDDNVDGAESLAVLLQALGLDVRTAYDGPTGLAAAANFKPDAVLLDIGLPRMDGYEVARQFRLGTEGDRLLLIALSGYGQEDDRRRSEQAGFDHHLVKPVSPDALLDLFGAHKESLSKSPLGPPVQGSATR
jgi:signal transduction histidine kinase/DNA-binding response OmpR family regulator